MWLRLESTATCANPKKLYKEGLLKKECRILNYSNSLTTDSTIYAIRSNITFLLQMN